MYRIHGHVVGRLATQRFKRTHALSRLYIPQFDRAVRTSAQYTVRVNSINSVIHKTRMTHKLFDQLARLEPMYADREVKRCRQNLTRIL